MPKLLPHNKYRSVTLFLLVFLPFLCFIGLLYLVSNECAISLRLTYYVASRVQSQSPPQPSDIL